MSKIDATGSKPSGNGTSGPAAAAYDIQVSTNLTDWTTIESNSPFSGEVLFTDTNSASSDHRFYRSRIFE